MKRIKKFGFMSWYAIISMAVVTAVFDWWIVQMWESFGGFDAWRAANKLWYCALTYAGVFHFFICIFLWLVWVCNED